MHVPAILGRDSSSDRRLEEWPQTQGCQEIRRNAWCLGLKIQSCIRTSACSTCIFLKFAMLRGRGGRLQQSEHSVRHNVTQHLLRCLCTHSAAFWGEAVGLEQSMPLSTGRTVSAASLAQWISRSWVEKSETAARCSWPGTQGHDHERHGNACHISSNLSGDKLRQRPGSLHIRFEHIQPAIARGGFHQKVYLFELKAYVGSSMSENLPIMSSLTTCAVLGSIMRRQLIHILT